MLTFFQKIKSKRVEINKKQSALLIFFFSILITLIMFYLSPESLKLFWEQASQTPSLLLLNYLPIILFMVTVFFIFNNSVLTISISSSFFITLSIINRVKIQMRQEPLLPTDISLVSEVTALLDKFNAAFIFTIIGILLLITIVVLLSVSFFKGTEFKTTKRLVGFLICLAIGTILNMAVYSNTVLYDKYPVDGNYYFKVNHYISKGLAYSFINDFNTRKVNKPEGYTPLEFSQIPSQQTDFEDSKKPHIIMVMGEAFTDLSINENINFEGYKDPLENFKRITDEPDTISGHIVVPNFGGGTADTEFDVLSGCQTSLIDNDLPSYNFITSDFDGVPSQLKSIDYNTLAVHPGNYWFYNRENVYKHMGFDDFLYLERDFDLVEQSVAGYITDEAVTETIIETFENNIKESDNPLFEFVVTIQNHGPFTNKYGLTKNFNTDLNVTDEQINMLSNYFHGLADADKQIADLVSYFEKSDEPVVLVYFGDHLPGFPSGLELFNDFDYNIDIDGTIEERLNLYKTPFMIWQNESAKEVTSIEENLKTAALTTNLTINAGFLGTALMELLGFDSLSPMFEFVNELRKELPVMTPNGNIDETSNYIETISSEQEEKKEKLKRWGFYKLFNENL